MTRNADTQSEKQTPALGPEQVLEQFEAALEPIEYADDTASHYRVPIEIADAAATLIRQQAAQLAEAQAGAWISVAERLPDNGAEVMFFDREHGRCVGEFWLTDDYPHWYANWAESVEFLRVTHWQPLPALPAQEASDGE